MQTISYAAQVAEQLYRLGHGYTATQRDGARTLLAPADYKLPRFLITVADPELTSRLPDVERGGLLQRASAHITIGDTTYRRSDISLDSTVFDASVTPADLARMIHDKYIPLYQAEHDKDWAYVARRMSEAGEQPVKVVWQ